MRILVWAFFALLSLAADAQSGTADKLPSGAVVNLPDQALGKLSRSYSTLSVQLQQQSLQVLDRVQKQEGKMQQKLQSHDSLASQNLFTGITQRYAQLQAQLSSPVDGTVKNPIQQYLPTLDSLQTAIRFLQQPGLATSNLKQLQGLSLQLTAVAARLQQANEVKAFIQSRRDQLQVVLNQYNLTQKLAGLNKQVYYYQQSIEQYKTLLQNRDQLAGKVLAEVRNMPAFTSFMQNHSYLSQLFLAPGSAASTPDSIGLPGLQTRHQVSAMVAARLGPGASFPAAIADKSNNSGGPLSEGMQQAQDQMNQWKDKIARLGGGNSNATIPDFQPNSQHNKTFFKRLQLGFDIQSQQSSALIPALSTLGLNLGYKLNDKSILGIGAAYKLGWGHPFDHIAFSSQGASIRSFINQRLKGSWWLSGGYEANYLNAFAYLTQLKNINAWQRSGLLGLLKTYKAGKRQGNIQLLYDFLHAEHVPQSQAILFRAGYSLF
jgi:hypothetical protein